MSDTDGAVVINNDNGERIGSMFATGNHEFWFLLDDERDDKPRGVFQTADEAVFVAQHMAKCMELADFWQMMLDT